MQAIETFPQTFFLPEFWSEYGMCTEPSAFGAISTWEENEFPFAKKLLRSTKDIDLLRPETLPTSLKDGIAHISKVKGLSAEWINVQAANIFHNWDYFI